MTGLAVLRGRGVWLKRLGLVGSAQSVVQILAAATGLIIVRELPVEAYAHYILCIAGLSAIAVLSESGFSSAILTLGGPVHDDPGRLRAIMDLAVRGRRMLAAAVVVLVIPALYLLLVQNGAGAAEAALLSGIVLASVPGTVQLGLLHTLLRLRSDLRRLQIASITAAFVRLAVLLPFVYLTLGAPIAVAVNAATTYLELWMVRRGLRNHLADVAVPSVGDVRVMKRSVQRMLPLHVFYMAQGQIVVVVLGALGATRALAGIAALGRFGVLFALTSSVWGLVVVPAYARLPARHAVLLRRYLAATGTYAVLLAGVVAAVAVAAGPLLALLGAQYRGLEAPLIVVSAAAAVAALGGLMAHLNQARGWLELGWLVIPVSVASVAAGAVLFELGTVEGAAWFSLFCIVAPALTNGIPTVVGLRRVKITHATVADSDSHAA